MLLQLASIFCGGPALCNSLPLQPGLRIHMLRLFVWCRVRWQCDATGVPQPAI